MDNIIRSKIANSDYNEVSGTVIRCIQSRIPDLKYKDACDWQQDVALFIILNKYAILSAENPLAYIIKCFYNKIKNCYAKKAVRKSQDIPKPEKSLPYDKIFMEVSQQTLKEMKNTESNKTDKLIFDYITTGRISIKNYALQFISKSSFYRRKRVMENSMKKNLKKELWIWDAEY